MKFLLDTSVLCELAKPLPESGCVLWLESFPVESFAVAAPMLGELWKAVAALERNDPQRLALMAYIEDLPKAFRVLPFDQRAAKAWGELAIVFRESASGLETMIAAIALSRDLAVVTRDPSPFMRAGCKTANPFPIGPLQK